MNTFCKSHKNVVICGDFNLDLLKVNEREKYSDFLDLMLSLGLCPKITYPTRFATYSASLLDLIFIKNSDDLSHTTTRSGILYSALSDHCGCFCFLSNQKIKIDPPKYVEIVSEDTLSFEKFTEAMSKSNLMGRINTDILSDPHITYAHTETELCGHINKFLPKKRVKFNKYKHKKTPWVSTEIMVSMHKRDNLYRKLESL